MASMGVGWPFGGFAESNEITTPGRVKQGSLLLVVQVQTLTLPVSYAVVSLTTGTQALLTSKGNVVHIHGSPWPRNCLQYAKGLTLRSRASWAPPDP